MGKFPPMFLPLVLLTFSVLVVLASIVSDPVMYKRFKAARTTEERQAFYRKIFWSSLAFITMFAIAGLALLGKLAALTARPPEFAPATALLGLSDADADRVSLVAGAFLGGVLMTALVASLKGSRQLPLIGDVDALLPRNRAELRWGALLSINAGIGEELFFRLLLPLLLAIVTRDAVTAFVIAGLLFAAVHLYQGWRGVLASMAGGALFTFLYLASGSIWLVALLHIIVDLRGLVLLPIQRGALRTPLPAG